jgi:hypothetical protein
MSKSKINPKSLKNLTYHEGRPKVYTQKKTTHNITVTPDGWKGIQDKAKSLGYSGVSEFMEQVGRNEVYVEKRSVDSIQIHSQVNASYEDIKILIQDILHEHKLNIIETLKELLNEELKKYYRLFKLLTQHKDEVSDLEAKNKSENQ